MRQGAQKTFLISFIEENQSRCTSFRALLCPFGLIAP